MANKLIIKNVPAPHPALREPALTMKHALPSRLSDKGLSSARALRMWPREKKGLQTKLSSPPMAFLTASNVVNRPKRTIEQPNETNDNGNQK